MKKQQLTDFEKEIGDIFNESKLRGLGWEPVHNLKTPEGLFSFLYYISREIDIKGLDKNDAILFEESEYFSELADPENGAYQDKQIKNNIWRFEDKYGNILEVTIDESTKYVEIYFIVKDENGKESKLHSFNNNLIQGNSDEHRSDTFAKILRDRIIPLYLINNKPSIIKIHAKDNYRHKIFLIAANICKEKYSHIEIKQSGKDIWIINK
jgi:hypothetical protein